MSGSSEIKFKINECDVTDKINFEKNLKKSLEEFDSGAVDFIIVHPPYLDIVKFTGLKEDLSQISDTKIFLEKIIQVFSNALPFLKKGKYFAVVLGDVYKNSEVVPLGFYVMNEIKKNFKVKLKGIVVKNIEGNRGKLGSQNIWKYRALKSDYFIFKHEYIFIFKKEF